MKPSYIDEEGVAKAYGSSVEVNNIFGILFDTEAIGIANVYEDIRSTQVEASQLFYNEWYHLNQSYRNDLTENAALFLIAQTEDDPTVMAVNPKTLTIAPGASGEVTVKYPQGNVTATVDASALADGVTAAYSSGKVTISVAGTTTVDTATVTITDTVTSEEVTVTIAASESKSKKK